MHACVTTFRLRTAPGIQSVTGIVDQDGVAFTPEYLFTVNGSSQLDTLYSRPFGPATCCSANTNVFIASTNSTGYNGVADAWNGPATTGFKLGDGAGGSGPSAGISSLHAQLPGGFVYRTVQITTVYSGGFDLNVLTDVAPDLTDVLVIALAADTGDFQMAFVPPGAGPTFATPFAPKGLLNPKTTAPSPTGTVAATEGGFSGWGWGWDSPSGGPMSTHVFLGGTTSTNPVHSPSRYQSLVSPDGFITIVPAETWPHDQIKTDNPWVTAWDPTSITFAAPPDPNRRGFILGGPRIVTASGRATQQATLGPQVITTGISPVVIFLMTCSAAHNPAPAVLVGAEVSFGVGCGGGAHAIQQGSFWVGETSDVSPLTGGCFVSGSSILRATYFGSNGSFTEFSAVASLTAIDPAAASFTIDWTATDPNTRELLWFAIGLAPAPIPPLPPPPPGTPSVRSWKIHRIDNLGRDEFSS